LRRLPSRHAADPLRIVYSRGTNGSSWFTRWLIPRIDETAPGLKRASPHHHDSLNYWQRAHFVFARQRPNDDPEDEDFDCSHGVESYCSLSSEWTRLDSRWERFRGWSFISGNTSSWTWSSSSGLPVCHWVSRRPKSRPRTRGASRSLTLTRAV
jgi:hypothetical protein